MIVLEAMGSSPCEQVENALKRIKQYVNQARVCEEDAGIGVYEYWGARGYNNRKAVVYDDESMFEVQLSGIPDEYESLANFWSDQTRESVTVDVDYGGDDYALDLQLVPRMFDGKSYYVVE